MAGYVPHSAEERQEMLKAIGISSVDELYSAVPQSVKLKNLHLPDGMAEMEVKKRMKQLAEKNTVFSSVFRGAGVYHHYIPSIVKAIIAKEEFLTAYTPYQPEISQGLLQGIFEFQTMICELTGMETANASVYDGACAAAEAVAMCCDAKRNKALVSETVHPMTLETIRTYCKGSGVELVTVKTKNGITDLAAMEETLSGEYGCVYIQQPNYFGMIEPTQEIGKMAKKTDTKYIMGIHPISCVLLKSPGECGADIAVGEGQPLGLPMAFGGALLGFMACSKQMTRKLPGRIVGLTADAAGKRAFVLTMQAREQHIRREKASSNICSNQAHNALAASVYLSAMGIKGLRSAAEQCVSKAHYAARQIGKVNGFSLVYPGEFFNEFLTYCPTDTGVLIKALKKRGILGGYPVEDKILWCVTECNTKKEIDLLADTIKEVCGK